MSKHTPGKWTFQPQEIIYETLKNGQVKKYWNHPEIFAPDSTAEGGKSVVARAYGGWNMGSIEESKPIQDANAHLIAASPDLYSFAVATLMATGSMGANSDVKHPLRRIWEEARAVVAKAEGGE